MPDPIKDLYKSLQQTGLFLDEADLRSQLQNYPKDVFSLVEKDGLFLDYDDFEAALALKKKGASPAAALGSKIGAAAPSAGGVTAPTSTSTSPLPLFGQQKKAPTDKIGQQVQKNEEKRRAESFADVEAVFRESMDAQSAVAPENQPAIPMGTASSQDWQAEMRARNEANLKLAHQKKEALLKQKAPQLYAPVKELLQTGKAKEFFDANGNLKTGKAIEYFDSVVKARGGGSFVRDMMVATLRKEGMNLVDAEAKEAVRKATDKGAKSVGQTGLLGKSLASGWYRGLSMLGNHLASKGYDNTLTRYLQGKDYEAEQLAPGQYQWNKDEWLDRATTAAGTSLGASLPTMLPAAAITIGTGGVGGVAVGGSLGFLGERAMNSGGVYDEVLKQTGDPSLAREKADEFSRKQAITLPLYYLDALTKIKLFKPGFKPSPYTKGFNSAMRLAAGTTDYAQELVTEYWQGYTEAQATGYEGSFRDYVNENEDTVLDTMAASVGSSVGFSAAGKIFRALGEKTPAAKKQFYADVVSKDGPEMAAQVIDQQVETGAISEEEAAAEKEEIAQVAQQVQSLEGLGVKGEDAKAYLAVSKQVQDLKGKLGATEDPTLRSALEIKIKQAEKNLNDIVGGKGAYAVITYPGGAGQTAVIPLTDLQGMERSGEIDELVKAADAIEIVGDEALNKQYQERKKALGTPEAPEGFYSKPSVILPSDNKRSGEIHTVAPKKEEPSKTAPSVIRPAQNKPAPVTTIAPKQVKAEPKGETRPSVILPSANKAPSVTTISPQSPSSAPMVNGAAQRGEMQAQPLQDKGEMQVDFSAKGGNKVVDQKGEPIVLTHGTNSDDLQFDDGTVLYSTTDEGWADTYGVNKKKVVANLRNPYEIPVDSEDDFIRDDNGEIMYDGEPTSKSEEGTPYSFRYLDEKAVQNLKDRGYDGVVMKTGEGVNENTHVVAFDKAQVKEVTDVSPQSPSPTPRLVESERGETQPQTLKVYRAGKKKGDVTFYSKTEAYAHEYNDFFLNGEAEVAAEDIAFDNPMVVELSDEEFTDINAQKPHITRAKKAGHDVVIFKNADPDGGYAGEEFYAVIKSNQGKKAESPISPSKKESERGAAEKGETQGTNAPKIVKYEDAIQAEHSVSLEDLPEGVDEHSRQARSQIIREREQTPPQFQTHEIGTYAVDRFGEAYQLQSIPVDQLITKEEGTQRSETVDKYAAWQQQTGNILPIQGVENYAVHGGKVVVTDGNHRVLAAKKNGQKEILVWVALTDPDNHARPLMEKDIPRHQSKQSPTTNADPQGRGETPATVSENSSVSPSKKETFREAILTALESANGSDFSEVISDIALQDSDRKTAVKNIRKGKSTVATKKVEEAIEKMWADGYVYLNRGRGDHAESYQMPIAEFLDRLTQNDEAFQDLSRQAQNLQASLDALGEDLFADAKTIITEVNNESPQSNELKTPSTPSQDTGTPQTPTEGSNEANRTTGSPAPPAKPKSGKYEAKARKLADKIKKADLPAWMSIQDPNVKKQGLSADDLKAALAEAVIKVGQLLDMGVDTKVAVNRGVDDIVRLYKEELAKVKGKLKPEVEATIRKGAEDEIRKDMGLPPAGSVVLSHKGLQEVADEFGLADVQRRERKSDAELLQEAEETMQDWKDRGVYAREVEHLVSLAESARVLTDTERVILEQHLANLIGEARGLRASDPSSYDEALVEIRRVKRAGEITRSAAGAALRIPSNAGSLPRTIEDAMVDRMEAAGVDVLTEAQKTDVEARFAAMQAALAEEKRLREAAESANARLQAEAEILAARKTRPAPQPKAAKQKDYKKERESIKAAIKEKLRKSRGQMNSAGQAMIDFVSIAPDVARLMKSYVEEGVVTLAEIIQKIHADVKEVEPSITEDDIRDIIAGKYNEPRPTKSDLLRQMQDLRTEAKLLAKLADLESGAVPQNPRRQVVRNQRIKELRDQIEALQKSSGLGRYSPSAKERAAIEAAKESIQEMERKLRENDLSIQQHKGSETPALRALRDKQKDLRKQIDAKRKEAGLGKWAGDYQLRKIKERNEAKLKEVQAKLKAGDFSTKPRPKPAIENPEFKAKYPELYQQTLDAIAAKEKAQHELNLANAREAMALRPGIEKVMGKFGKALRTLKATMAGIDMSALGVQNLPAILSNPYVGFKAFKGSLTDMGSAAHFERELARIHASEWWPLIEQSGLSIIDPKSLRQAEHNDLFNNTFYDDLNITRNGRKVNIAPTKPFERQFTSLGNYIRINLFLRRAEKLLEQGKTFENSPESFKTVASIVNNMTGRGSGGEWFEKNRQALSTIFWSPGLMSSSFNLLGISDVALLFVGKKGFYGKILTSDQKLWAAGQIGRAISTGIVIMLAIAWSDDEAEIDWDPTSVTFGYVKSGDYSWSIFGRFTKPVRYIVMRLTGIKNTPAGEVELDDNPYGATMGEELYRGVSGYFNPVFGTGVNIAKGTDFSGQPTNVANELGKMLYPMSFGEFYKGYQADGVGGVLKKGVPSFAGIRVTHRKDFYRPLEAPKKLRHNGVDVDLPEGLQQQFTKELQASEAAKLPVLQATDAYRAATPQQRLEMESWLRKTVKSEEQKRLKDNHPDLFPELSEEEEMEREALKEQQAELRYLLFGEDE